MVKKDNKRNKTIYLAYKYRLILKKDQKNLFCQWAGNCRYVYNWALSLKDSVYKDNQTNLKVFEISRRLTLLKKEPDKQWLNHSPAQTLQQAIRDLHVAYTNFFKKTCDFPRYKKKGKVRDSFRFPQIKSFHIKKLNKNKASLILPKVGLVKLYYSQEIQGTLRNATLSRKGQDWYISLCCEKNLEYFPISNNEIGLDRGIVHTLSSSQGRHFDLPKIAINKLEKRKAFLQRRLMKGRKVEKKEKWSCGELKKQTKINKLDTKIKRIRHDWMHKTSTQLAKNHSLVVLEDLNIKGMMKSAKGTCEKKGINLAQKRGLNRSLARQAWGIFERQLSYKMQWVDSLCVKVDPRYSSQECSRCFSINSSNRVSQAHFVCLSCGYRQNADVNAALNLLRRYKDTPSGGGVVPVELSLVKETVKQEPLRSLF